jgi:hypothetical protein
MNIVYQSQNSNTPSILSSATAIAANPKRIGFTIENQGTNPLFVLLGSGASTTVFHRILKGSAVQDDGSGDSLEQMNGVVYTGIVTIAGTSPRYTVLEIAP